jgi:steroid delta-isomerase-like uncharacterized protein
MSTEANKAVVRRLYDLSNRGDVAAFDELHTPDYVGHVASGSDIQGSEAARRFSATIHTIFPDLHFTLHDQIAEGDLVAVRWTFRGTHRGEYLGVAPTGKQVTVPGMDVFRLAGGTLVEGWTVSDRLGLLRQLGAIPAPKPTAT